MSAKQKRILICYLPVIHRGYLDLFSKHDPAEVWLLDDKLVTKLGGLGRDKASLSFDQAKQLLANLGIKKISLAHHQDLLTLKKQPLLLVNDQVGRELLRKYFPDDDVVMAKVFLRWDSKAVFAQNKIKSKISTNKSDIIFMNQAYEAAQMSSDWWRQVGAVVVKGEKVILSAYNQGMPTDHSPYQDGAVRDVISAGERSDLANYIHAEQVLVAQAAKQGTVLRGSNLYVTHFPCPVCAKLVAKVGFGKCYFAEGSSSLDGERVMKDLGVELVRVDINAKK